jgi:hypothetical protein
VLGWRTTKTTRAHSSLSRKLAPILLFLPHFMISQVPIPSYLTALVVGDLVSRFGVGVSLDF